MSLLEKLEPVRRDWGFGVPVGIGRSVIRENLTPECVYRRKGFRGNRAGRRMLELCFRPYNHPNGAHAGLTPVSEAWKSFAKRRPIDAEFYALEMMRQVKLAAGRNGSLAIAA